MREVSRFKKKTSGTGTEAGKTHRLPLHSSFRLLLTGTLYQTYPNLAGLSPGHPTPQLLQYGPHHSNICSDRVDHPIL